MKDPQITQITQIMVSRRYRIERQRSPLPKESGVLAF
jgi:competence CoiA-like predicted nuclease